MPDPNRLTKKGSHQYSPSESAPEATPAPLPTSKYPSSSAYPTPSTVQKPEQGTGTRVKSMPPLDFNAATAPPPELEELGDPNSDDLSEDEGEKSSSDSNSDSDVSDAYKGEDEDEENKDEVEKAGGKGVARELAWEVIELDSSPGKKKGKFRNVREMEEYFESMGRNAVFEASDEDLPAAPNPSSSKSAVPKPAAPKAVLSKAVLSKAVLSKSAAPKFAAPKSASSKATLLKTIAPKAISSKSTATSGATSSKLAAPKPTAPKNPIPLLDMPDIKLEEEEEEEVKPEGGDVTADGYNKIIVRSHVLKCMTSLCSFKKAHEAANLVSLYEENGEPKWFKQEGDGEVLVPHFDCPFQDNMDGWGKVFDAVVENSLRMGEKNRAHLQTVPIGTFRSVLSAGAFATMKEAEMPDSNLVEQFLHNYEPDKRNYLDAPGVHPDDQSNDDTQIIAAVPSAPAEVEPSVETEQSLTIGDTEEPRTNAASPAIAVVAAVTPPPATSTAPETESAPNATEEPASESNPGQEAMEPANRSSKRSRKLTNKAIEGRESGEEEPELEPPAKRPRKEPKEPKKAEGAEGEGGKSGKGEGGRGARAWSLERQDQEEFTSSQSKRIN
ncbi:hypothetical protein FRC08_005369 [Ceratobasidium sp. 394]|nr:hypothetical protein FRC08_005369 [Ceratobasidium sp. 394]